MKKLMKLLIATALVLTMAVCFAACGGKTMNKAIVYEEDPVAVATKTGYLSDFDGNLVVEAEGEWVVFSKNTIDAEKPANSTTTYTLYNVATEKVAAKTTVKYGKPCPYSVEVVLGGEYSVGIYTMNQESTIFYGENKLALDTVASSPVENPSAGLVDVGDYIFKMVDGEVSYVKNETASIANIDDYAIDEDGNVYYYDTNEEGVTVYDANLNLYGYVKVPSYAQALSTVLSNGNVLIQHYVTQDPYGDDYDMIEVYGSSAYKSNLTTILYNIEKNSAKEIKFDYVLSYVDTENLAEKVDNIAYLYEIKDNRVDDNDEAMIVAKLSNNGKVGTIFGKAEDYLVNAKMEAIAADRFLAESITGEKVLYDAEMEKIATFSEDAYAKEQYIIDGDKYYKFDGSLIVDLAKYDGEYNILSNGNVLFVEDDDLNEEVNYFLLAKGAVSKIATHYYGEEEKASNEDVEMLDFGSDYYVITRETVTEKDSVKVTTYVDTIYNMNGEKLTETVAYEMSENVERKATVIRNRQLVLESEGLLVFSVEVKKYDESKDKDDNVIGYDNGYVTEYYYCK